MTASATRINLELLVVEEGGMVTTSRREVSSSGPIVVIIDLCGGETIAVLGKENPSLREFLVKGK